MRVVPGSAAESGGILKGDLVTALDTVPLDGEPLVHRLMTGAEIGQNVSIRIVRPRAEERHRSESEGGRPVGSGHGSCVALSAEARTTRQPLPLSACATGGSELEPTDQSDDGVFDATDGHGEVEMGAGRLSGGRCGRNKVDSALEMKRRPSAVAPEKIQGIGSSGVVVNGAGSSTLGVGAGDGAGAGGAGGESLLSLTIRRAHDEQRWGFAKVATGGKTAHEQKVLEVEPGSAAMAAGVLPKDVVVAVDGEPLLTCDAFGNFIVGELADKLEAALQIRRPAPKKGGGVGLRGVGKAVVASRRIVARATSDGAIAVRLLSALGPGIRMPGRHTPPHHSSSSSGGGREAAESMMMEHSSAPP